MYLKCIKVAVLGATFLVSGLKATDRQEAITAHERAMRALNVTDEFRGKLSDVSIAYFDPHRNLEIIEANINTPGTLLAFVDAVKNLGVYMCTTMFGAVADFDENQSDAKWMMMRTFARLENEEGYNNYCAHLAYLIGLSYKKRSGCPGRDRAQDLEKSWNWLTTADGLGSSNAYKLTKAALILEHDFIPRECVEGDDEEVIKVAAIYLAKTLIDSTISEPRESEIRRAAAAPAGGTTADIDVMRKLFINAGKGRVGLKQILKEKERLAIPAAAAMEVAPIPAIVAVGVVPPIVAVFAEESAEGPATPVVREGKRKRGSEGGDEGAGEDQEELQRVAKRPKHFASMDVDIPQFDGEIKLGANKKILWQDPENAKLIEYIRARVVEKYAVAKIAEGILSGATGIDLSLGTLIRRVTCAIESGRIEGFQGITRSKGVDYEDLNKGVPGLTESTDDFIMKNKTLAAIGRHIINEYEETYPGFSVKSLENRSLKNYCAKRARVLGLVGHPYGEVDDGSAAANAE